MSKVSRKRVAIPKAKDLTGQRFGKLLVLESVDRTVTGHVTWKCKCDCGEVKTIVGKYLRGGDTKSCGCLQKELSAVRLADLSRERFVKRAGKKPEDFIGETFNYFKVKGVSTKDERTSWIVECGCGNERNLICHALTSGRRVSCGCVHSVHKLTDNQISQLTMNYLSYKWNIITTTKQGKPWEDSFDLFADWALESGFELGKHLMLHNVYLSHSPDNCYWE